MELFQARLKDEHKAQIRHLDIQQTNINNRMIDLNNRFTALDKRENDLDKRERVLTEKCTEIDQKMTKITAAQEAIKLIYDRQKSSLIKMNDKNVQNTGDEYKNLERIVNAALEVKYNHIKQKLDQVVKTSKDHLHAKALHIEHKSKQRLYKHTENELNR